MMKGLSTSHKLHCTPCGCVVLDLSKNSTIGSLCWINSLATNVSIVDLDLSSCSLQITNENGPPFISMLKENQVLTADRYSGLPYPNGPDYANAGGNPTYVNPARALATLQERLQLLSPALGQLQSYRDFVFLLEQLSQSLPNYWPGDTGYSR